MHEKIKELALQAGGSHYPNVNSMQLIKFAELIVRECADIANRQFESATGLNDRDCLTAAEMKKHFGVDSGSV